MNPETTAALVGAVIGGAIGFLGTLVRDKLAIVGERRNLAIALQAELRENAGRFSDFAEVVLGLPESQPLERLFSRWSGQQFFPIYDNSTYRLGWFRPEDTVKIVHAVGQFKDLMEHINLMHDREARYSQLIGEATIANRPSNFWAKERQEIHVRDADRLRPVLKQLMEDADKAIGSLQKYAGN